MDLPKTDALQSQLSLLRREGEERAAQRLAQSSGSAYIDLSRIAVSPEVIRLISEEEAKVAQAVAIELKGKKVALAGANPRSPAFQKVVLELQAKNFEVRTFAASMSAIEQAWRAYRFVKSASEEITGKVTLAKQRLAELAARLKDFAAIQEEIKKSDFTNTSPKALLEIVIAGALSIGASDIHFESEEKHAKIRLRVDGILHDIFKELPLVNYGKIISRVKLISGMKINVRNISQDGRFTIEIGGKEIEVRASVIPSEFGENIVMRLLDPEVTSIGLKSLGIREDDLAIVESEMAKPNGLILNTGPTGSGKTTTLYAFLRHVNSPEVKIITLEDPIEYRLEGVEQTQVNDESGYTFANGLRAIVRQDPDIILVGEVRDSETADIAIQASLTGHLVLSTLHTNDAVGAVPRLVNLGIKSVSIGPSINLIIAQRLTRKLCPHCKKEAQLDGDAKTGISVFLEKLPKRVDVSKYKEYKTYELAGCDKCNGFGYKGRIGIFEFLQGGPELEKTILRDVSEISLRDLAKRQGMVTMQEDGILKVLKGETSFAEVESATGKIEWIS